MRMCEVSSAAREREGAARGERGIRGWRVGEQHGSPAESGGGRMFILALACLEVYTHIVFAHLCPASERRVLRTRDGRAHRDDAPAQGGVRVSSAVGGTIARFSSVLTAARQAHDCCCARSELSQGKCGGRGRARRRRAARVLAARGGPSVPAGQCLFLGEHRERHLHRSSGRRRRTRRERLPTHMPSLRAR
jgi:hypothetical protein